MDRRRFLNRTGLAIGAGIGLPALGAFDPKTSLEKYQSDYKLKSWSDLRNMFDLETGKTHMALMLLASHPKPIQDEIERHRNNFDQNPAEYWEENFQTAEPRVIAAAAKYLNADPSEVALTDSTTQGLGILYTGMKLRQGEEILTTTHDHYSTEKALEFSAERSGASIKRIDLYEDPSKVSSDEVLSRIANNIGSRTRLLAVTWVHSCTGVKLPISEISELVREKNQSRDENNRIFFAVDGVHAFGLDDIDVRELGCDFLVAGCHKWLFGPRGTGILWAKREAQEMVVPVIPAFSMAYGEWLGFVPKDQITFSDLNSPGGFHAFEHRWSLHKAFEMHSELGKKNIVSRSKELNSLLKEGIAEIPHAKLLTPMSDKYSEAINCFEVDGLGPDEIVSKLHERNIIASSSPYRKSYARLTPSVINTEEEVEKCLVTLRAMT
ncbi:aminotransferase class V-fold PLP-dependent enzyme [Gramella sp. GC03-9]|uniref:Aminotransferase class V-fold PLP-dependent enzyme n=1 Tax=Christiangramia oceanisediminis TaxID=2920386 RepID=A0A9X2I0R6_9FLAO|nr:aminotransferase class V-fold PLP-dependent enzyme [Gramella oceanisediminis]MCP9198821.1 aminotransferase class V-fold PLP-dependent enzyme [Gramella oceanisediminis]